MPAYGIIEEVSTTFVAFIYQFIYKYLRYVITIQKILLYLQS